MTSNKEEMELIRERFGLACERLSTIGTEESVPAPYRDFFVKEAGFLALLIDQYHELYKEDGTQTEQTAAFEELKEKNEALYADILPAAYGNSYGNPDAACRMLGAEYGKLFSWLYAELRGMISFVYEGRLTDMTIVLELFLETYGAFSCGEIPTPEQFRALIYAYNYDYCADFMRERVADFVDPSRDFARRIIMGSDLDDLRYLFCYGLYISENEIKTAAFFAKLPPEQIEAMAHTYTEGYRKGFENAGIDLSRKKTVNIRYSVGFERMIRAAVRQFAEMGLESVIYRTQSRSMEAWSPRKSGYLAGDPNPQYHFDHKEDYGLYLNEKMVTAKLSALTGAYESMKQLANTHAGPAVQEVFGEEPFMPESKENVVRLSTEQQQLMVRYNAEAGQITSRYIIGEERSFTIIAFPSPAIGPQYEDIFRETVRINTLDYMTYRTIQQKMIDALDCGVKAVIKGRDGNETDLTIALQELADPSRQTNFENCVADVNIPVGEVFTTPKLAGTNGLLHVKQVYLNGLNYLDLKIRLENGMIRDYSCGNFDTPEKNRKYIEENILFHHPTLPIGEFAIGTNTTAFEAGKRYGIQDKLPILISEKTGPHFAFGDTCFSRQEELHTFNPDGKEITAKDNDCSLLRKTDVSKAYFGCHTDITIPYDELGSIRAVRADGEEISIIEDGMFVLPGSEELNIPLKRLAEQA